LLNDSQSNWCPEVYRGIFVDHYNHDRVRVAPCCQAKSTVESVEGFNFNTSTYLTKLRKQFSQGEKPTECSRCWQAEARGTKSRRQSAIEFFKITDPDQNVILESIDHNATWACNSACIMCSPELSSTWATELGLSRDKLSTIGRSFQKKNTFFNSLDLSNIKKIQFNGGEPMLNNDQIKLLEQVDLSDATVSYNTNGTVYPDQKIIDIWKKTKLVKLFFSIDATEQAFEYIRYPGKWQSVADNIIAMKKNLPSNVMFGFNVTVASYNLLELAKVYDWFVDNISTNRECDLSDFCWQLAYNYDVNALPQHIKQQAIYELESIEQYQGLVSLLKNTNTSVDDTWIKKLNAIDQRRQTDWKKSLKIGKYF
jgi:sulfatase maturation enzyme AslB (radical SAM superfamily)